MEGQNCAVCGKNNVTMKCGICKRVWYCSSAHQQQDWTAHKKESCDKFKIQENQDEKAKARYVDQIKVLADKYLAGENNLPLVLEMTVKMLGTNESKNVLARMGYQQLKQS